MTRPEACTDSRVDENPLSLGEVVDNFKDVIYSTELMPHLADACEALRPRDMLSQLPHELLDPIFEDVRLKSGPYRDRLLVGAISKSLLHFTRRNLFHSVELGSRKSLNLFWRTMKENEDQQQAEYLVSLVRTLKVCERGWKKYRWTASRAASLLAALPYLEKLAIIDSNIFLSSLYSIDTWKALKALRALQIPDFNHCSAAQRSTHPCTTETLSLHSYAVLQYGNLKKLSVYINPNVFNHSDGSLRFPPLGHGSQNATVTELTIHGFLRDLQPCLIAFLEIFTCMKALRLESTCLTQVQWKDSWIPNCFEKISPTVERLTLTADRSYGPHYFGAEHCLDHALIYLPNIISLTLNVQNFTPPFFHLLADCCHLERIHFERNAKELVFDDLKALLKPGGPPSLKKILIDNITGYLGLNMFDSDLASRTTENEILRSSELLPRWPQHLSYKQAVQFVSLATQDNISVTGSILPAIRFQIAYDTAFSSAAKKWYPELTEAEVKKHNLRLW